MSLKIPRFYIRYISNEPLVSEGSGSLVYLNFFENALTIRITSTNSPEAAPAPTYLVGKPRHVGESVGDLFSNGKLFCSLMFVPEAKFKPNNPGDVSWWRGGPGPSIGDLFLVGEP